MVKAEKKLRSILHSFGLKATSPRLKVLGVMSSSPAALSHYDITTRLHDQNIDKVTLYRILIAFSECGLAHKVANEERNWLYALHIHEHDQNHPSFNSSSHAHFICDNCERIYCLPITIKDHKPTIGQRQGFIITSHEYRLHGKCPDCN